MELNKEQITFIDSYLKGKGVNYSDIRLEMIDHVDSKIEESENIVLTKDFLFKEFGPYYEIQNMVKGKKKLINKKYRNQFFKEIHTFFKSLKNISLFFILYFVYFQCYLLMDYKIFQKTSLIFLFVPAIIAVYFYVKDLTHFKKSIHLEYAFFYMSFSFIFINLFIQFTNPKGIFEVPAHIQSMVFMTTLPLYLVFMKSGCKVYRKTQKTYSRIYNEYKNVCN